MPLHASVNDVSAREAGSRCWSAARPSHGDANPHGRQDTEVKSYTAAPALGPPHRDAILTFCPSLTLFIPLRAASAHARGFDRCSRASAHDAFMGRSGALTVSAGRRPDRIDDEKAGEQLKEVSEPARSAGARRSGWGGSLAPRASVWQSGDARCPYALRSVDLVLVRGFAHAHALALRRPIAQGLPKTTLRTAQ